jgi:hypothetical protein
MIYTLSPKLLPTYDTSGQDNIVPDTLSHVESVTAPPSYDALAASQDSDKLQTLLESTTGL